MKGVSLFFLLLPWVASCQSGSATIKGVHFQIKADFKNAAKDIIEVKSTIYNDNVDTLYFLTSTCEGEQYSLRYDATKLDLVPDMLCNTSFTILVKVAPKGQYEFYTKFLLHTRMEDIKMGFDLYVVDKKFQLSTTKFGEIFNRPEDKQTIIWSDSIKIKDQL